VILLVEDDEDVREMLAFALTNRGFRVESVPNGRAALASIEQHKPCLVILDLVMPLMSGREVIAEMQARDLGSIPVCVISALSEVAPKEAIATLAKPFEVTELVAIAERYCSHTIAAASGA
jgi:DNA-binding response OmpR family regulator